MKFLKGVGFVLAFAVITTALSAPASGYDETTDAWKDQVIMTIEPGKYANSTEENDYFRLQLGLDDPATPYVGSGFFGGDINGITANVPHLKDLGISTALLYPIMSTDEEPFFLNLPTGYNISDWSTIDPNFNTPGKAADDFSDYHALVDAFHDESTGPRINVMQDLAFTAAGFDNSLYEPLTASAYLDFFRRWNPDDLSQNISSLVDSGYQTVNYKQPLDISAFFNADVFSFDTDRADVSGVLNLPAELVGVASYAYIGGNGEYLGAEYADSLGFRYGTKLEGHDNAVMGSATQDRTIDIPDANYAGLSFLATAEGFQQVTVRVTYTDGTFTDSVIGVNDISTTVFAPVVFGHLHSPGGDVPQAAGLYAYTPRVDPTKVATSMTLRASAAADKVHILAASSMPATAAIKVNLSDHYNEDGFVTSANATDASGPIGPNVFREPLYYNQYQGNIISNFFPGEPVLDREHVQTQFVTGPATDGRLNMVYADGQEVDVQNERYHEFRVAAFGTWGVTSPDQPFTVVYTDGTTDTVNLTIKPMNATAATGDVVVYKGARAVTSFNFITDPSSNPSDQNLYGTIWGYKIHTDWQKEVDRIVLPDNSDVHIAGISPIVKIDHSWALPALDQTDGMAEGEGAFGYLWDNVLEVWLDQGIDGVRIDSVQNFDPTYWQTVLNGDGYIRDTYPDAAVFGEAAVSPGEIPWHPEREEFTNASGGIGFDGIYDWETADTIRKTFAQDVSAIQGDLSLIEESLEWDQRYEEPWNQVAFFNVYENYPFLHLIDESTYPTYEDQLPKIKLAAAYLFSINRVPMLFSGNEYLLEYGEQAPRGSAAAEAGYLFTDDVQNDPVYQDNYAYMKNLIGMRNDNASLSSAERLTSEKWIQQGDTLFGFVRHEEGSAPIVAMFNNSPNPVASFDSTLPDGVTGYHDWNFLLDDSEGGFGAPDETVSWPQEDILRISEMQPWEVKIIRLTADDPTPASISINEQAPEVFREGMSFDLSVSAELTDGYTDGNYTDVIWTSNKPQVVSVDENGLVTANRAGRALITVTDANNPALTDQIELTVRKLKVLAVVIKPTFSEGRMVSAEASAVALYTGAGMQLDTDYDGVEWSSDNPAAAVVDEHGTITVVNPGGSNVVKVTITATDTIDPSVRGQRVILVRN